jgi:hypothetical protein
MWFIYISCLDVISYKHFISESKDSRMNRYVHNNKCKVHVNFAYFCVYFQVPIPAKLCAS